ncbi:MAG: formylglycine-generating enzyme family protein [Candidatus Parabeggiatoa sp.]|nr:formylglycine-generating enzyme family protein [Candidatus Parabeggiatoa sp.]
MTTHDDQLFQLLSEFETWQDGHALNEQRLVQHDLVLAHLARLYGSLSSHSQHFGLLPSYSLTIEIQEQKPLALSNLLALTATGKLLVCAKAAIPECDNPSENKGLFAIAKPLKLPETLQKTWPVFPFYQVQLEWQAWQSGIDEIVKTGEGLPLGRLKEGQWDADYIPPVMTLPTDKRLWQQALELMNQVSSIANHDKAVAEQVLTLQQSDLSHLSPLAFWQGHCHCLVALKTHPKLADDPAYQKTISKLLSEAFSPWMIGNDLAALRSAWQCVEEGLDKKEKAASKPRRYVSLGWYVTSMVGMMLFLILIGLGLIYQPLSKELTKVDNQIDWLISTPGRIIRDRLKDDSYGPEMVVIPADTFWMGDIQGDGESDEKPVHEVSIKSFAMGRYEVTFAEYDKFAEATARKKPDDEGWGRGNRPVINVSWLEVTAYAEWLSTQTGKEYRLPTETEWEYAARAGTETKYWWGNEETNSWWRDEITGYNKANCSDNDCGDRFEYTAPVGSFAANLFGLYDTAGNVWEWTCSEYEGTYKGKENDCLSKKYSKKDSLLVLRGASWVNDAVWVRSSFRGWEQRSHRDRDVGARLARTL